MENKLLQTITDIPLTLGAYKSKVIAAKNISLDASFRDMCASNACGVYGKCWMCPPDVGDINALMAEIQHYDYALVYQTVTKLEDSFDFEGMVAAKKRTYPIMQKIRGIFGDMAISHVLFLGAGGCGVCETCAKVTGEACRSPHLATPSLEAYGVNVSALAKAADMKYINGPDTVTYFGAVLFSLDEAVVRLNDKKISAQKGALLSEITGGEKPCGGHGKCGKCKVYAKGNLSVPSEAELSLLSAEDLSHGVRLACLTHVLGDCEVKSYYTDDKAQIVTSENISVTEIKPSFSQYGIAIDIGTTTLAAQLYDNSGTLLCEASRLNPQIKWGADVISRIEAALDGDSASLADAIRKALDEMICNLCKSIDRKKVDGVVITGNTVMLSLLVEQSVEPFSHAPFAVERLFGETLEADDLSLSSLCADTPIYLPPCLSAFVGADISCAILASALKDNDAAILVDIGTNGEMVLWQNGRLTVCSTAAGPAFEGVGISMGMRGEKGAIDRVWLQDGKLLSHTIGETNPIGLCGSGLIDAVASLVEMGEMDETGVLSKDTVTISAPAVLIPKDIRMLQLAKSAICAGLRTLVETQGVSFSEISTFYIAGGFGNYLNIENAVKIGLLPKMPSVSTHVIGNAALNGAAMILLNRDMKNVVQKLSENVQVLDLSTSAVFSEHYMMGMLFEEQE